MRALPTTRAEALRLGLSRYFTGKPCHAGHIEPRYTVVGECTACRLVWQRKRRITERETFQRARRR